MNERRLTTRPPRHRAPPAKNQGSSCHRRDCFSTRSGVPITNPFNGDEIENSPSLLPAFSAFCLIATKPAYVVIRAISRAMTRCRTSGEIVGFNRISNSGFQLPDSGYRASMKSINRHPSVECTNTAHVQYNYCSVPSTHVKHRSVHVHKCTQGPPSGRLTALEQVSFVPSPPLGQAPAAFDLQQV